MKEYLATALLGAGIIGFLPFINNLNSTAKPTHTCTEFTKAADTIQLQKVSN